MMTVNQLFPFLLFSFPWMLVVFQLHRGLTQGEMREFRRNEYREVSDDRPDQICRRATEPKTFWCLFAFYLILALVMPIGAFYASTHQTEPPPTNPGRSEF